MSIDTDYETLRHVLTNYSPRGWAIEFGVFSGYSLAIIAEHMPVIGLDSFEGLPEDWREGFPKGSFGNPDDILWRLNRQPRNSMLVEGWFHETLPILRERGIPQIGLVHIDCDLYSSTVTALEGIADYIHPGTIIVFDEFHGYEGFAEHEMKAWYEFCAKHVVVAEQIAEGPQEAAFVVTGIKGSH